MMKTNRRRNDGILLIVLAISLGVIGGGFFPADRFPNVAAGFQFLSKAFIQLIKGIVVPLVLSTLIVGIAKTGDVRAIGRMGGKALLYFEVVTGLALVIGLIVANWVLPGKGMPLSAGEPAAQTLKRIDLLETVLHAFPSNVFAHASVADLLPLVVFATLFGIALTRTQAVGQPILSFCEGVAATMMSYTEIITRLTPLGVFGAMAYNVSHLAAGAAGSSVRGWPAIYKLLCGYARLVGSLYLALLILVVAVFVPILFMIGVSVRNYAGKLRRPALIAFTTTSSEAALPELFSAMTALGVPPHIANFVVPAGYSFNLDGSTLYLVLASTAIAQAAQVHLSLQQQVLMMLMLMLTSKGIAGVPRASLVVVASTCGSFGLPAEAGVAMLLAVDELMDMGRTAVNVLGNGLAALVITRWEQLRPTQAVLMQRPDGA